MAAIICYGPLIDLSKAAAHIDEYVQLLVFVHNITPIQVLSLLLSVANGLIRYFQFSIEFCSTSYGEKVEQRS